MWRILTDPDGKFARYKVVDSSYAIALHNIPEGISVSVPIYYATGNRRKAFWLSFLSGLSEPVGALAGYIILRPFFSVTTLGVLFASVAGIMVFILGRGLKGTTRLWE